MEDKLRPPRGNNMNAFRSFLPAGAGLLMLALSGCGGGGGGGDDNHDGLTDIRFSSTSLTFSANNDDANPPPAQTVTVTASGGGTLYIKVDGATGPVGDTSISCNGTNQCTLSVTVDPPYSYVNPGHTEGTITVIGCADQACNSGTAARGSFNVSYDISPGFAVSTPSLQFNTPEGGAAPPPQTITLTKPSGTLDPWRTTIAYTSPGPNNWLLLTPASTTAASPSGSTMQVAVASGLPQGNYTARIDVFPNSPRHLSVQVVYAVTNALNAEPVIFTIDAATLPAGLQQTITMTNSSPQPIGWTATESIPWAQLSRTQGDTAAQNDLQVSLLPAKIERMPRAVYRGVIAIAPTVPATFTPFEISVVFDLRLPLADFATPYVVASGTAGDVYLRGSGFNSLAGSVLIDGTAATYSTRDGDTQIRFGHAALTAGTHTIDVGIPANSLGLNRDRVKLVARDPLDFNAASLATAGTKRAAVYDSERQALYVVDSTNREIERYRWNGTTWASDALPVAGSIADLALMPDGRQLLALGGLSVTHIDLDTFTVAFTVPTDTGGIQNRALAVGNDGIVVISRAEFTSTGDFRGIQNAQQYDTAMGTVKNRLEFSTGASRPFLWGSKLYMLNSSGHRLFVRDTLTDQLADTAIAVTALTLAAANDGKFIINAVDVYGADLTKIGTLSAAEALQASAVSADGTRAYAYGDTNQRLYIFDLAASNGSGGFNQVGTPLTLSASPGGVPLIVISTDGRTAFVVGTTTVNVVPLPH
jgi:hypothetical protein